jgi:hypothetical protein
MGLILRYADLGASGLNATPNALSPMEGESWRGSVPIRLRAAIDLIVMAACHQMQIQKYACPHNGIL